MYTTITHLFRFQAHEPVIRGFRYSPAGTLRRSSSEKFSRKTTWFSTSCDPLDSVAGISATMRLPSFSQRTSMIRSVDSRTA